MFRDHGCWEIFILVYDLVLTVALTHNLCTEDWSVLSDVHLDLSASLRRCHDHMSRDHRLAESHGELAEILLSSHVLSAYRASHCSPLCLCPDSFNISVLVAEGHSSRSSHRQEVHVYGWRPHSWNNTEGVRKLPFPCPQILETCLHSDAWNWLRARVGNGLPEIGLMHELGVRSREVEHVGRWSSNSVNGHLWMGMERLWAERLNIWHGAQFLYI